MKKVKSTLISTVGHINCYVRKFLTEHHTIPQYLYAAIENFLESQNFIVLANSYFIKTQSKFSQVAVLKL